MSNAETVWSFETANLKIEALFEPCSDLDLSGDEDDKMREGLANGQYKAFNTIVRVTHKDTDAELGSDVLCESIYARPLDFIRDHRSADPMNRNCSIMRAARGQNVAICHYFPEMVQEACREARKTLRAMQSLKVRT